MEIIIPPKSSNIRKFSHDALIRCLRFCPLSPFFCSSCEEVSTKKINIELARSQVTKLSWQCHGMDLNIISERSDGSEHSPRQEPFHELRQRFPLHDKDGVYIEAVPAMCQLEDDASDREPSQQDIAEVDLQKAPVRLF